MCNIGNTDKVQTIRVNNYLSVINWLEFPNTQIDFYAKRIYRNGPFTSFNILPSDLVYVCGLETRQPCQVRPNGRAVIAGTIGQLASQVVSPFGATLLVLCPRFFRQSTFAQMGAAWTSNPQTWVIDASSTLLHEAQHMIQLTGPAHLAIDVTTAQEGDCYKIDV
jgi:hypothetical protein